jgi:hypothetical protein
VSGIRVYVPCTIPLLRDVVASGGVGPAPLLAHAVTDALRAAYSEGGEEEWEYAASTAAAQASLGLLHDGDVMRRVVLAVDVPAVRPADGADPTLVQVDEVVPFRRLAAVLADDEDAESTVAHAASAWRAAGEDPEADAVVERCLDHELGWYAAQEVAALLDSV